MAKFGVIITAAGSSTRFGGNEKKQFEEISGRAVFMRAAEPFIARDDVASVIVTVAAEDLDRVKTRWGSALGFHGIRLVAGGSERVDSVAAGFELIPADCDHVAIHDAARPLVDPELIDKVFREAVATGAAIPALPLSATLKRVEESPPNEWGTVHRMIAATLPRESLWLAQTPQAFRKSIYAEALAKRSQITAPVTDDAQLVEAIGHPVSVIMGAPDNFKITTAADLAMAKHLAKAHGFTGPTEPPKHHRF
ncbi:MAG: 2-C-methyl-D-erythritol 4-phosphate cytidylyltransferase [Phycisphaerae bacterium]|nr:2-C-methyl-D-erythritol 4-phosphate cytidylyltransferase [Phycisphaerae bacterium]